MSPTWPRNGCAGPTAPRSFAASIHGDAVASNGGVLNKGGLMVEETLRILCYLSGPGIEQGQEATPVWNIDFAPTLLDLCGASAMQTDGMTLRPLFERKRTV